MHQSKALWKFDYSIDSSLKLLWVSFISRNPVKMVYALSRLRIFAPPHLSSSNHLKLLAKTSVSYSCRDSFRFCRFGSLIAIRKVWSKSSSNQVSWSKQNSDWDLKSAPPIPFDICNRNTLTDSISEKNEEEEQGMHQAGELRFLRPGMVLLKQFLTPEEQVSIVRECRSLGLGPGGFYWPHMRLMLMCLGLDWDPHTRKYNKTRRYDKCRVPDIPNKFITMVKRSINAGQALTKNIYKAAEVEEVLPMLSPDICVVNFYTTLGKLGLHQDRDESRTSLAKGLPIVSVSVGDSGEFYYGDVRDIRKANKVVLESGDVLIFGGPSRHIFHGVDTIIPRTAPEFLFRETGLLPGRLNLTFRQY